MRYRHAIPSPSVGTYLKVNTRVSIPGVGDVSIRTDYSPLKFSVIEGGAAIATFIPERTATGDVVDVYVSESDRSVVIQTPGDVFGCALSKGGLSYTGQPPTITSDIPSAILQATTLEIYRDSMLMAHQAEIGATMEDALSSLIGGRPLKVLPMPGGLTMTTIVRREPNDSISISGADVYGIQRRYMRSPDKIIVYGVDVYTTMPKYGPLLNGVRMLNIPEPSEDYILMKSAEIEALMSSGTRHKISMKPDPRIAVGDAITTTSANYSFDGIAVDVRYTDDETIVEVVEATPSSSAVVYILPPPPVPVAP